MTDAPQKIMVGFCIYCGKDGVSDEHWMPKWLGGTDELLKASCGECQDAINAAIENPMSHGPFWSVRRYHNFRSHSQTKRRRKHKGEVVFFLTKNGERKKHFVPERDNPGILILHALDEPGIYSQEAPLLSGGPAILNSFIAHLDNKRWRAFCGQYDFDEVDPGDFYPEAFRRFLAKLALGAAIQQFGYRAFRPLVRDLILNGGPAEAAFYVGGINAVAPKDESSEFAFESYFYHRVIREREYLVCLIRLFAAYGMPFYEVVVGELRDLWLDEEVAVAWNISVERLKIS